MPIRFAIVWLLLSLPVFADQFDSVRGYIQRRMTETRTPSITVAVARDGRIIWEEGFGWADREKRVAANEHTPYSMASISKPITATGLMMLVEQKRIDLDRPINQYLGSAKLRARIGNADEATVRRVANHSSGLPLHYQFFYEDEPFRPPSMDETILRYGNLVTLPGEKWEYSNLGFGILDYVMSRVSGEAYDDYMRQSVFLKLGLTHTSVGIGPGFDKLAAVRYGQDGLPIPFYDFDHRGASAVYSSAHDLVRFAMFHLKAHLPEQSPLLTDASIDEMQKPTAKSAEKVGYGIGWMINEDLNGYRVVSHTGGMGGVSTTLRLIPSEKLAVVVLCNSSTPVPHQVSDQILAALLPKWHVAPATPPAQSNFRPTPALIGTWIGTLSTYKADMPLVVQVLESGDVHAKLGGQFKMLLNDVSWENNVLSGRMLGDIETEDANRRPYYLQLNLKLRGSLLNGSASAISQPARRVGNALTQWVELKKD
jgi:CubicO group peptidase (beta-lactamase class C family)